jgi:inosine/xanthosine triphosphatase
MKQQRIAVGSKRGPKLDAVHDALEQFAHLLDSETQFEAQGFEVESGVRHTPLSSSESMLGARQRVEALMQMAAGKRESFRYYVGLEGGLEVVERRAGTGITADARHVFLESWAYVSDGTQGHFGRSGAIQLPEALAYEVLDRQIELAAAIDKFAGMAGVRDGQGAWGILSRDLITRKEAFRIALVAAFAPFYNAKLFCTAQAAHNL